MLLFSKIFPKNKTYSEHFLTLWNYVKQYSIDNKNKGWYWGSIEKEPHMISEPKGSIWKASYHDGRSLMNCIAILTNDENKLIKTNEFKTKVEETTNFINHWKNIANNI